MTTVIHQSQGQPVAHRRVWYQQTGCCGGRIESYHGKPATVIGAAIIVLGCLVIIINVIGMVTEAAKYNVYGVAALLILTGAFSVCAGQSKANGWIIASLMMSVLTLLSVVALIVLAAEWLAMAEDEFFYAHTWLFMKNKSTVSQRRAVNGCMLLCGIVSVGLLLTISILDCMASCCGSGTRGHVVASMNTHNTRGQVVTITQTQQAFPMQSGYHQQQQRQAYPHNQPGYPAQPGYAQSQPQHSFPMQPGYPQTQQPHTFPAQSGYPQTQDQFYPPVYSTPPANLPPPPAYGLENEAYVPPPAYPSAAVTTSTEEPAEK